MTLKLRRVSRLFFLLIPTLLSSYLAFSQCNQVAFNPSCSGGNGAASNGQNINGGERYWYSGTATFANLALNGGDLVVCGDLTISSISINSGRIFVRQGGRLRINNTNDLFLNGNVTIVNRGVLRINSNVILQNSNNVVINESSGVLRIPNGRLEMNSPTSFFVNNGLATIQRILVQNNALSQAVCLGNSSFLELVTITNNQANSFYAPNGPACVYYTGNANLSLNLSNTADVHVCQSPSGTTSGGAGFGSATVFNNCPSCGVALPVELMHFDAVLKEGIVQFEWETASERNNQGFIVQRSIDGEVWDDILEIEGAGNSTDRMYYTGIDDAPLSGSSYYRLKQIDFDGNYTTFDMKHIYNAIESLEDVSVHPNPFNDQLELTWNTSSPLTIEVVSSDGQLVYTNSFSSDKVVMNLAELKSGLYVLRLSTGMEIRHIRLVKK